MPREKCPNFRRPPPPPTQIPRDARRASRGGAARAFLRARHECDSRRGRSWAGGRRGHLLGRACMFSCASPGFSAERGAPCATRIPFSQPATTAGSPGSSAQRPHACGRARARVQRANSRRAVSRSKAPSTAYDRRCAIADISTPRVQAKTAPVGAAVRRVPRSSGGPAPRLSRSGQISVRRLGTERRWQRGASTADADASNARMSPLQGQ